MLVRGEISHVCDFCQNAFRAPALVCRPSEPELSPPQPHIPESNALPGEAQSAVGMKKVEKQIASEVKKMQKGDLNALKVVRRYGVTHQKPGTEGGGYSLGGTAFLPSSTEALRMTEVVV